MAIDAGKIIAMLELDTGNFMQKLDQAQSQANGLGDKMKGFGDGMSSLGKGLTAGVTAPITALGAGIIKTSMDFESGMSQVAATMGFTSEQINNGHEDFEKLKAAAKEMGATTKFSATEASEALNYLALAGFDADKSVKLLPKSLALAAAGGLELGRATDMVTDSMSALGLTFEEVGDDGGLIDQMARTAQKSNTSVGQLGDGILKVGATAKNLAGGTNELNTALGLLANIGFKGAEGGTKLRNIIMAMTPTTDAATIAFEKLGVETYDAQGNLRGLNQILFQMSVAMEDMSQEEKTNIMSSIFNKQDLAAASGLMAQCSQDVNYIGMALEKMGVKIPKDDLQYLLHCFEEFTDKADFADTATKHWGWTMEQAEFAYESLSAAFSDRTAWDSLSQNIANSEKAASEMAKTMENNVKGQMTLLKSNMEGVAIQLGEIILPVVNDGIKAFNELVTKFGQLSPETQKTIVKFAAFAAAMGPVLFVGGKLLKVGGSTINMMGKLRKGIKLLAGKAGLVNLTATATEAAGAVGGGAGLAGGFGASLAAAAPWVIGIGAAAVAGYGLYKVLSSDAIPALKLFDDSMSEATKNGITSFMELEKSVNTSLTIANAAGKNITEEMKNNIVTNVTAMKDQIVTKMNEQKEAQLSSLREMVKNAKDMTEEEKKAMLKNAEESFTEKEKILNEGVKRVTEIYEKATKEHRKTTEAERNEINAIIEGMKEDGIRVLTESEQEYAVIRQRMKDQAGRITAEQVADLIQKANEQKEKTIQAAEEEYNERIKIAEQIRSEGTAKAKEQADKIVEEARRQRDDTIKAAEEMHKSVIDEAKAQAGEHIAQIDFETGEIKSRWQQLKEWFLNNPISALFMVKKDESAINNLNLDRFGDRFQRRGGGYGDFNAPNRGTSTPNTKKKNNIPRIPTNATGTSFFGGGLTWVGEHGAELIELPRGSKVHNRGASDVLSRQTQEVRHSGTIRVEGVNSRGELNSVVDILMDKLRKEALTSV